MKHFLIGLGKAALIALGILSAGMGLKGFLIPSNFIDGGVTGVSMLLSKVTAVSLSIWLPLVNVPFILLGYRQMGRTFALKSALSIAGLAIVLATVPYPDVTQDKLLIALFGGFFLGAGVGLAIRGGAVLDGTEIAGLVISKHGDLFRVGDVILLFNAALFTIAILVLGVEGALYSILTYAAAARTINFILHGLDEYTAITIVSDQHAAIRSRIIRDLGRGVTIYKGYGGMSGSERDILYCVVTRLEVGKVKAIVQDLDPSAFIVFHPLTAAVGGVVKKRAVP